MDMDPELTEAEVEALNKLVDDVEKLNKQMQRFEESRRLQAESRANKFDFMLDVLEQMVRRSQPEPLFEDQSTQPENPSQVSIPEVAACGLDDPCDVEVKSIDVTIKSDSAVATGVFDLCLDVSTIDSTQAEVIISVHSSSMIALSKKEIKNEKDGLEFGNTVCLQSWYSPQSIKPTPFHFKSVLVPKIDDKRHKSEDFESGTTMSRSLNFCTEPVRRNVCEIFPFFLPPAKPPDDSSKVLSTEFSGNVTLHMPPYAVVDEIMCLEICFDRPRTCNLGGGDFLKRLLLKEQIVRPMLNIKVGIVVVMFVIDLAKCTFVGWCNANTVRHLKEMVDNTKLVRGFDKRSSHFVGIILRYTNLAGEVGLEADIMKFNGCAGGNIASLKRHCILINGEWKADVIVCGGTWWIMKGRPIDFANTKSEAASSEKSRASVVATKVHFYERASVTTPFPNVEFIAGGATQNSIKFAQWMLQVPGATSFMGSIGKDKYGEEMEKNAKIAGVNVLYYKDEQWALVEKAKYYYIAGFFLTVSPKSIQLVAQHAAANNKVFSMNLSAPFICEFFRDVQEKALPYMGYVFCNETEARTFSKVHGWKTDDVEESAIKISQWPKASGTYKRITVITQGADPVVIAGMNDMRYEYGICRFRTTFISAGFGAFLARYINNFFMFSLPRPPEIASFWRPLSFWFSSPRPPEPTDLEDKVNFKGRGMLRTQYYRNKGVY